MNNIAILGSTGSIGQNSLDVIRTFPDRFRVFALAAGNNIELLASQVKEFDPEIISVKNRQGAESLRDCFPGKKILYGENGLMEIVSEHRIESVITAIQGTDALEATVGAIRNHKRICLANKETMVAAGELINREIEASSAEIVPIDSEQSAIFQCLAHRDESQVKRLIITASGGPFLHKSPQELEQVTLEQALCHPVWAMGKKITIDSATLMNKALEIIEAHYLFHIEGERIKALIHPQSIIHSLVEFIDSSTIAQMSLPDMRIPILYSLTHPDRISGMIPSLDFASTPKLEFYPIDPVKFPAIELAYFVLRQGKNAGAVFQAANEVAVEFFCERRISFRQISEIVEAVLQKIGYHAVESLDDVLQTIADTRKFTSELIEGEFCTW